MKKVFIKITTVPLEEDLQIDSAQFELYKETYQEPKNYTTNKEVIRAYYDNGGLNPMFSRIYSITMAYVLDDKEIRTIVLKGDEKNIINSLFNYLKTHFKDAKLVGWNFDFLQGFMKWRPIQNGININSYPEQVKDMFNRPWSRKKSICLFEESNPGWHKFSAKVVFNTCSLDWKFIEGSDVYVTLKSGGTEEVEDSDVRYIVSLVNLDRILNGESTLGSYTCKVEEVDNVEEIKDDRPVLHKLFSAGNFSAQLQEEVRALIGKKRLTKADKVNLRTILRGVMVQTDFVNNNQDTKAVIAEKEAEVDEFINTL